MEDGTVLIKKKNTGFDNLDNFSIEIELTDNNYTTSCSAEFPNNVQCDNLIIAYLNTLVEFGFCKDQLDEALTLLLENNKNRTNLKDRYEYI